ncbi:MAG: gliding motility-associatede transport system auxiliary component [Chloroflexota bacterium]|nr:gliding motility-associatede transport system auxiliary component [Chloroflexota bacterium]
MALTPEHQAPSRTAGWAARGILVVGVLFVVVGLSLLILFGFSSPGLPAAIWGLLLIVVYGFFEPDTMRSFLGQGQLQAGTRALASVLLVIAAVVLVNVFVRDKLADKQWDLTKGSVNSLAPQTVQIVKSLDKPVTATLWSSQSNTEMQAAYDLLQRYRALNGKITINRYTVLERPTLARSQKIQQAGSVVFESAGHPSEVTTDASEQGLDTVLSRLSTGRSPKAYFLTGHGEPDTAAQSQSGNSITVLAGALQKQGITVAKLNLSAGGGGGTLAPGTPSLGATPSPVPTDTSAPTPAPTDTATPAAGPSPSPSPPSVAAAAVPADADELVILDPQSDLTADEIAAINKYMDGGGHLMVSEGPFAKSNVGQLIKRFGLSFGPGIVIDQQLQVRNAQGGILQISKYGSHLVSRGMETLTTILLGAAPVEGTAATGFTVTPIINSQTDACERVDATNPNPACDANDKKGPFNVMVAVEQSNAKAGAKQGRAVVMGGAVFAADLVALSSNPPPGNQPLMVNAVNWLAGQDKIINVAPHTAAAAQIFLTDAQKQLVLLGYPVLLPLLMLGLGVNAYLRRR